MRSLIIILLAFFPAWLLAQVPAQLPGLELWVRGDSATEIINERLASWGDLSLNNRNLTQGNPAFRPQVFEDTLAGHTAIGFDGTNHRLIFDEIDNVRTMFLVFRETIGTSGFSVVMGHSETYPFFRGPNNNLWHFIFTSEEVLNGTTRLNFNEIDGTSTVIPQGQYQILSLVTTGDVPADQFGQDRDNPTLFNGELAEIIITSVPLDSASVAEVENYLADYYSPELDLGADIFITDSFCDTTIYAPAGFSSYEWSTGSTDPSLVVNQSGVYWLDAIDSFGRLQSDTIEVSYPGSLSAPNQSEVCLNDSLLWDTELNNAAYEFNWSDGSDAPFSYFSTEGPHSVTVTDLYGCSQTSEEWMLQVDSFAVIADLGPDRELCAGNQLTLEGENDEVQSYLWQDEFSSPSLTIESSGEYWLEAANTNGCLLFDTVFIDIVGLAPNVEILSPPFICQHAQNTFLASASSEDSTVDTYEWLLNDDQVSENSTFEWSPELAGPASLSLIVGTAAGCNAETTLNFTVNPQPQGNIIVEGNCAGDEIQFSTFPQIESGSVASVEWLFAAEAADGASVIFTPQESGFQSVELLLTSNVGCANLIQQLIDVQPTPIVSFTAQNTCEGDLMPFASEVSENGAGAIVDYSWFFGDGGSSGQANPAHFYSVPGIYDATFGATGANGCSGWFSDQVEVIAEPVVNVPLSNACSGDPVTLQAIATSQEPVVDYQWIIEGVEDGTSFTGESVTVTFIETGFQPFELEVSTESGCSTTTSGQFPVFAPPIAAFTFTPEIGGPPLEVQFVNESQGVISTDWDFGDGFASGAFAPTHTYEEEGVYQIRLVIENVYGCPDTTFRSIDVTDPYLELSAQQLFATDDNGRLAFTLQAVNQSNFTLSETDFSLQVANGSTIVERSEQPWLPGEVRTFTWEARFEQQSDEYPWVCATVEAVTSSAEEVSMEDNRTCTEIAAINYFAPPFPNPVVQGHDVQMSFTLRKSKDVHWQVVDGAGRVAIETEPQFMEPGFQKLRLNTAQLRPGHYRVILFTGGERAAVSALQVQ